MPDFYYSEQMVAVYIDGMHHQYADIMAKDRHITNCLEDAGYTVIRFGEKSSWDEIVRRNGWLFGELAAGLA